MSSDQEKKVNIKSVTDLFDIFKCEHKLHSGIILGVSVGGGQKCQQARSECILGEGLTYPGGQIGFLAQNNLNVISQHRA